MELPLQRVDWAESGTMPYFKALPLTHVQCLFQINIRLEHADDLFAVSQGHATARFEDTVQDGPKRLQDLAIDNAAPPSVEVGPSAVALEYVAVYMPNTHTTHNLGKLGPANIGTPVETLTKVNTVPTPDVVQ